MKRVEPRSGESGPARPDATAAPATHQVWQPRRSAAGARAIASLVPGITRKSFEKHGFAAAALILEWRQIVGAEMARDTRPLKLKWPRQVETYSETPAEETGRPGATLVVQVDPAAALDVQYKSAQLIERINAYFGYRAVTTLKLVQEAIALPETAALEASAVETEPDVKTQAPADPLAAALARLGQHIKMDKAKGKKRG